MENLKLLRKERNLTQADVAKVLNITVSAYGNYELGQRSPTPEMLIKLARFYNVSVDVLLNVENNLEEEKQGAKILSGGKCANEHLNNYIDILQAKRKKIRISYDELDQRSGLPKATITNTLLKYFKNSPRIEVLDKLAIALEEPSINDFSNKISTVDSLTADQQELLMYYIEIGERLGPEAQKGLIAYAKFLADGAK